MQLNKAKTYKQNSYTLDLWGTIIIFQILLYLLNLNKKKNKKIK